LGRFVVDEYLTKKYGLKNLVNEKHDKLMTNIDIFLKEDNRVEMFKAILDGKCSEQFIGV